MTASSVVMEVIESFLGPAPPVHLTTWDGSSAGDPEARLRVRIRSPMALRRLLWSPNELGLARAYVAGDIDVDGSIFDLLGLRDLVVDRRPDAALHLERSDWLGLLRGARRLGVLGWRPTPPPEEARVRRHGRLHSRSRDRAAISHHYDVGNDFYRLVLGPTMTYSCAYFPDDDTSLDDAQRLKYELVSRKLGLRPGMRLLDVGCGWGGMVLHAAEHHGVEAVGVTLSQEQADLARARIYRAGLTDRVDIRLCDYRDLDAGTFDAISSIGMFEHVGHTQMAEYLQHLHGLLRPGGRLLNHAITRVAGDGPTAEDSFLTRYVFPDGHLHEVGRITSAMQDNGFECRDVESLREHYGVTLRHWIANLEANWDEAVRLVGGARARIWRLYMAGSAIGFEANRISIHQVLATATPESGVSGMPRTRPSFADVGEAGSGRQFVEPVVTAEGPGERLDLGLGELDRRN